MKYIKYNIFFCKRFLYIICNFNKYLIKVKNNLNNMKSITSKSCFNLQTYEEAYIKRYGLFLVIVKYIEVPENRRGIVSL